MNVKWIWKWKWINNGYVNGKYNGNEFGKRFDYNEKTSLIFNNEHTKQSIK